MWLSKHKLNNEENNEDTNERAKSNRKEKSLQGLNPT